MGNRRVGATVVWKVNVPEELAVKVDLLLIDPRTGKPRYGLRSQIITELLTTYIGTLTDDKRERLLAGNPTEHGDGPTNVAGPSSGAAATSGQR
jgi:hypothetical protein